LSFGFSHRSVIFFTCVADGHASAKRNLMAGVNPVLIWPSTSRSTRRSAFGCVATSSNSLLSFQVL
jgi:hypothetical protein